MSGSAIGGLPFVIRRRRAEDGERIDRRTTAIVPVSRCRRWRRKLDVKDDDNAVRDRCTKFGSMLFTRCVSGTRWSLRRPRLRTSPAIRLWAGARRDDYPEPYFTAACALGASNELADFVGRLDGPSARRTQLDAN